MNSYRTENYIKDKVIVITGASREAMARNAAMPQTVNIFFVCFIFSFLSALLAPFCINGTIFSTHYAVHQSD